jgi:hypothetical protein
MLTALITTVVTVLVVGCVIQETVAWLKPLDIGLSTERISEEVAQVTVEHFIADLHFNFASSPRSTPVVNTSRVNGDEDEYGQLCHRSHFGVGLFEMALMSVAPYLNNGTTVARFVSGMNAALGSDWTVEFPTELDPGPSRKARQPWKSIVELHSESKNATFVAIRGTDPTSMYDLLQDVSIYVESFLYQLMTHVLPAAHLVPTTLICDAIGLASTLEAYTVPWIDRRAEGARSASRHFHDIVIAHVSAMPAARQERVAFVGHSLGGAVGHIAAARLGLRSFGIQSPGIILPRKKFGVGTDQIHRATTTVAVAPDVVPLIGWQGGDVIHARCTERITERCHIAEQVVAAIWQNCAAVRDRHPQLIDVWVA